MRHIKNYFIKSGIQVKFVLFISLIVVLAIGSLYFFFETSLISIFNDMGIPREDITSLTKMRLSTIAFSIIIIVSISLLSVLYFHSFTGPLFALERSAEAMLNGDLTTRFLIRKNDELNDLSDKLDLAVVSFRKIISHDRERAQDISRIAGNISTSAKSGRLTPEQIKDLFALQEKASLITKDFTL